MNLYEHTIIARQDTSPSELKQLTEKYSNIVEKNDGEVVKTEKRDLDPYKLVEIKPLDNYEEKSKELCKDSFPENTFLEIAPLNFEIDKEPQKDFSSPHEDKAYLVCKFNMNFFANKKSAFQFLLFFIVKNKFV